MNRNKTQSCQSSARATRFCRAALMLAIAAGVTACGGGGDNTAVSPTNPAPANPTQPTQPGNPSTPEQQPPGSAAPQPPARPVTPMVAGGGNFTLALKADGRVFAWGDQELGQLGNGSTSGSSTRVPQAVQNLQGIVQIAAGRFHALALRNDGTVFAWGANGNGRLGIGQDGGTASTPIQVPGLSGIIAVAAGERFSLALRDDGSVAAWGDNSSGQLGMTDAITRLSPATIPGLASITSIAAGSEHALALRNDSVVFAWGNNGTGQLGLGNFANRSTPTRVPTLADKSIAQLAAGGAHSLARSANGRVFGFGSSNRGQVGVASNVSPGFGSFSTPVQVPGIISAISIAAGAEHSLARLDDSTARSWGNNGSGRLGNGAAGAFAQSTFVPQVVQANQIVGLAAGGEHSLIIINDGKVACFGDNFFSECGRFEATSFSIPIEVGPGFNVNN